MDPNYFEGLPNQNNAAMPYMNKAIGEVKGYYDPYTQYANNPQDFINSIYSSFQDSPALQRERELAGKGLTSAAAASGRINNPAYERQYADLMGSLGSEQMRRYMQDVMAERGLGFQAAQGAAGDIGNIYNQAGGLSFQQDLQKKSDKRGMWDSLLKGLFGLGGAAIGGAPGAAVGAGLSNWFSDQNSAPSSGMSQGMGSYNPNMFSQMFPDWRMGG